jgi:hypothetical protein
LAGQWNAVIHTRNDRAENIIPASVYLGYRLALAV